MKKQLLLLLIFACLTGLEGCKTKPSPVAQPTGNTEIEFRQTHFNFGEIAAGEIVTHTFYYKNTGNENFFIRKIESSCGCTTVDYSKQPIPPGKEGKIEIAFNSSGRYGKQYKEIRIFANLSKQKVTLSITADVK